MRRDREPGSYLLGNPRIQGGAIKILELQGSICQPTSAQQGLRKFGVPQGGPLDTSSAQIAVALGLAESCEEVYEVTGSLALELEQGARIGICGAQVALAEGISKVQTWGCSVVLQARVPLKISQAGKGTYFYLALSSPRRQSAPTFPSFPYLPSFLSRPPPSLASKGEIRITSLSEINFEQHEFIVSPKRNRMGMRLSGLSPHDIELPSEPTCPGVIQWTPSGEIIVLGPDGPTLGGYPNIGTVIETDRGRLAQLKTGAKVHFQLVSFAEARKLDEESTKQLRTRLESIRSHLANL